MEKRQNLSPHSAKKRVMLCALVSLFVCVCAVKGQNSNLGQIETTKADTEVATKADEKAEELKRMIDSSLGSIIKNGKGAKSKPKRGKAGTITLTPQEAEEARALLLNPDNYKTNTTVFGEFRTSFTITLSNSGKRKLYISFDFGLRKWRAKDAKGETIATYDLRDKGMLGFARKMFPKNEYYKIMSEDE